MAVSRNDRNRAITNEDLIRRYNLEELVKDRKAIKTLDKQLTTTYGNIKRYISKMIELGSTTQYFQSGTPTFSSQANDLYYDTSTGNVYLYTNEWVLQNDSELKEIMSIANDKADVVDDNVRLTFFEQPTPPYSVGDIWVDGSNYYRCIISEEDGSFNINDWLDYKEYREDYALNNAVRVLDNQTKVISDTYATKTELTTSVDSINSLVNETRQIVTSTNNDLQQYKTEVTSQFEQTAHNFELSFNNLSEITDELLDEVQRNSVTNYMRFTDNGTLIIGRSDSEYKVEITNEGLNIVQGDGDNNKVAYFNNNKMYITNAEIISNLQLGNFAFTPRDNGSLSFGKNK
jgi:hypothetical protein